MTDYNQEQEGRDPTHGNALDPALRQFQVITGESYLITASSAEEAEEKLIAHLAGEKCPCGSDQWGEEVSKETSDLCECVGDHETLTISLDQD